MDGSLAGAARRFRAAVWLCALAAAPAWAANEPAVRHGDGPALWQADWPADGPADWRVAQDASRIDLDMVVNGRARTGRLRAFSGRGAFDPAAPERSALELVLDLRAVDMGSAAASALARSGDWFAVARHPEGRFRLDGLAPLADGRWRAEGTLRLRGVTRPMAAELSLTVDAAEARVVGEAVVAPAEFGIGGGPTGLLVRLGPEIRVRFDLRALRDGPAP